jgi:hypothetical protein
MVEKYNKYVFEDDLIPHSPREKVCKLCTFPNVYVYRGIGYWEVYRSFQGRDFSW